MGTGVGVGGGGGEGMREWRLDCGYRPEKTRETVDCCQNNEGVKAVSLHHCAVISTLRHCCFNCRGGQSHKDSVYCTAVEEQPEVKEVHLSQPSSTSLLMISSGLTWGSNSTSLLLISPGTLKMLWKDFLAFTQGVRQRIWPGWL